MARSLTTDFAHEKDFVSKKNEVNDGTIKTQKGDKL